MSENTAQRAKSDDLGEAERRLTSLKTYRAAGKGTCSQLATDHETSAWAPADELEAWQMERKCSRIRPAE